MSRGGSYGGGQSSLGYLFGSDQQPSQTPVSPPVIKAPWDDDNSTKTPPNNSSKKLNVSNNYHRAQGQNSGNFLTDRPTTKVQSAPGGESSLGYLFGDK
ncbi:hypothetical protein P3X46_023824 [Hevea brasiliensis]|uniref:Protein SPIRAL1-like 5 n=2 Tax=Hevea brasiliensis TaxID=3981 RepID=A0A6A6MTL9_HEVBR|nr:protein SPIRAL1-like 5 [Hevea brasiliensis]KAF2315570.1 hypothetical protein GH714_040079 [Hevea brasiliensis]KAF2315646.1 hypothetical protein GH714_040167 [Hevea brasiliensis]KAJ9164222.1 hypothetical protein P3X46_023824 [Hevea brasiliensis]